MIRETRQWVNSKLKEINLDLKNLSDKAKEESSSAKSAALNFRKFIELKENLHRYWLKADLEQKKKIADLLLLNLSLDMREIRSVSWKPEIREWRKSPELTCGGDWCHRLELYLEQMWDCFVCIYDAQNCSVYGELLACGQEHEKEAQAGNG